MSKNTGHNEEYKIVNFVHLFKCLVHVRGNLRQVGFNFVGRPVRSVYSRTGAFGLLYVNLIVLILFVLYYLRGDLASHGTHAR